MVPRPALALLFSIALPSAAFADPPTVPPAGAPGPSRTVLVPHTRIPIAAGTNVVWCATIHLAWDALFEATEPGRRATLAGLERGLVDLGRSPFPREALRPESTVIAAGRTGAEVSERARAGLAARFPHVPAPDLSWARGPVAFAYLEKDLPFAHPFPVQPSGLAFAGGKKRVAAFGLPSYLGEAAAREVAGQAAVYLPKAPPSQGGPARPADGSPDGPFVVALTPKDDRDRVVLARVPSAPTLEEAWRSAEDLMSRGERHVLRSDDHLTVPRVSLEVNRRFRPSAPAGSDAPTVDQHVRLDLDEHGARVRSAVVVDMGRPRSFVFDRPFLLALIERGAPRPYLLLWVGNDDILGVSRSERPDAATLAALAGTWRIDPEGTRDHARKTWPDLDPGVADEIAEDQERFAWKMVFDTEGKGTWSGSEMPATPIELRTDGSTLAVLLRDEEGEGSGAPLETHVPLDREGPLLVFRFAAPYGPPALVFRKE